MKNLLVTLILLLQCLNAWAAASRSFDGASDEIDMGNVLDVTTGDVSLCAWIKSTEDADADHWLGKKNNAIASAGYHIRQAVADTHGAVIADGTDQLISASAVDSDGIWTWVCSVYNGSTQTNLLYEFAVQTDSDTNTSVGSLTNAVALQIGETADDGSDANGLAAYASVWVSKIMTQVEVAEFMWKPDMAEIASGFWPLWGDATEIDLSANANTGTVTGATTSGDGPPVMFGGGLPI